jgi:hypothetical protein
MLVKVMDSVFRMFIVSFKIIKKEECLLKGILYVVLLIILVLTIICLINSLPSFLNNCDLKIKQFENDFSIYYSK